MYADVVCLGSEETDQYAVDGAAVRGFLVALAEDKSTRVLHLYRLCRAVQGPASARKDTHVGV